METMQQIRRAYRKAGSNVGLAAFARENNVHHLVKAAHKEGNKARSEGKQARTRAASASKGGKK